MKHSELKIHGLHKTQRRSFMKKLSLMFMVLFVGCISLFADAPQSWRQALEASSDGHEDFDDGREILDEIEDFEFTDTSNTDLTIREAIRGIEDCDAAISEFKRAKSHFGTAARKWTYYLDHHYDTPQSNRDTAKDNRSNARNNVEACNNSIDYLEEQKEWLEGYRDTFEAEQKELEEFERLWEEMEREIEEEEKRKEADIKRFSAIGENYAPSDYYETPGFKHPDWGSSKSEIIAFETGSDSDLQYIVGDHYVIFLSQSHYDDGTLFSNDYCIYYFNNDKFIAVSYNSEFPNAENYNRHANYYYNKIIDVYGSSLTSTSTYPNILSHQWLDYTIVLALINYKSDIPDVTVSFYHPLWEGSTWETYSLATEHHAKGYDTLSRIVNDN